MSSTTQERSLIVKADRERLSSVMSAAFDVLEDLPVRVDEDRDPGDETRIVSPENLAEMSVVLEDVEIHLAEFQSFRERLDRQRSYLAHAYAEQETDDA